MCIMHLECPDVGEYEESRRERISESKLLPDLSILPDWDDSMGVCTVSKGFSARCTNN